VFVERWSVVLPRGEWWDGIGLSSDRRRIYPGAAVAQVVAARRTAESGNLGSEKPDRTLRLRRWELPVLGIILLVFAGMGAYAIAAGPPLIFDEAVYSLRAGDFAVGSVPSGYWMEVRAPGFPLLLTPLARLSANDELFRSGALLFAVVGVALTWWEGRLLFGRTVAPVAASLVALSPGWSMTSWQVLPDITGATLALACVVLLTTATQGEKVRWWALLAAPVAAFATAVRFGAPLLIAPALLIVVLVRWRVVRRSLPLIIGVGAATLASTMFVLLVPAVTGKTNPPLLIFLGRQVAKQVGYIDRLLALRVEVPMLLGPLIGLLIVIGIGAVLVAMVRRDISPPAVIGCIAVGVVALLALALGIADHQIRYFTPAVPFLALGAAPGLVWLASRIPSPAMVVAVGAALSLGLLVSWKAMDEHTSGRLANGSAPRQAALELGRVANKPCAILSRNPNYEWYSGCKSILYPVQRVWIDGEPEAGGIEDETLMLRRLRSQAERLTVGGGDAEIYMILSEGPSSPQPRGPARDVLLSLALGEEVTASGDSGTVHVYDLGTAQRVLTEVRRMLEASSK
jgi:Dolichyl-phosphate-mannose-protein mannosyltransferase